MNQKGQGTVEYALLTLAVVIIIGLVLLGANPTLQTAISGAFTKASQAVTDAGPSAS